MIDDYETAKKKIKYNCFKIKECIDIIRDDNKIFIPEMIKTKDYTMSARFGDIDYIAKNKRDTKINIELNKNDCKFETHSNKESFSYNTVYPCYMNSAIIINKISEKGYKKEAKLILYSLLESTKLSASKKFLEQHGGAYNYIKNLLDEIEKENNK